MTVSQLVQYTHDTDVYGLELLPVHARQIH